MHGPARSARTPEDVHCPISWMGLGSAALSEESDLDLVTGADLRCRRARVPGRSPRPGWIADATTPRSPRAVVRGSRRSARRASAGPADSPAPPHGAERGMMVRARTIRRIGCRRPRAMRISGRTITSKTTSALTGFDGSRKVGTSSGPAGRSPAPTRDALPRGRFQLAQALDSASRTPSAPRLPPTAPAITTTSERISCPSTTSRSRPGSALTIPTRLTSAPASRLAAAASA